MPKNTDVFFEALGRVFYPSLRIFMAGTVEAWRNRHLCAVFAVPTAALCFILAYPRLHLTILGFLLPGIFTPERTHALSSYPFAVHFFTIWTVSGALAVFFLGIKPFGEKKAFQDAIDALGLATGTGKKPRVLSIVDRGNRKKTVTIYSYGVAPKDYTERRERLQSSLDWILGDIRRGEKPKTVEIDVTEKELPKMLPYGRAVGEATGPYEFPVGWSLSGMVTARLEELPHLLIAGATGSGKSTFLNAVLMALLEKPGRIRFYGIDLKKVELAPYRKFPRFRVDDDMEGARRTLGNVKREMERRYGDVLEKKGRQKIDPDRDGLDRIVVVIDECSDLFGKIDRGSRDYRAARECRETADVLARKGRAAGIHLILATQRVSAQTLDSRILANIPAKVCFQMATVANSVLVLNSKHAFELDKIPGRGYWSFGRTLEEVQVPYIDPEEVRKTAEVAEYEHGKDGTVSGEPEGDGEDFDFGGSDDGGRA